MKLRRFSIPALLSLPLLLAASSLVQAYSAIYYVIPTSVSLRECAASDCAPLQTVYQGDKVEILERTGSGWSKVKLVDRAAIGWIPSNLLSYSPDLQAKPAPPYYVNKSSVELRDKPNPGAKVLTTLGFHDQVEMLGVGTSGWAQVRDLKTSLVGWVDPRYISAAPPSQPKPPVRRRVRTPKKAPPVEEEAPQQPSKAPSAM